MFRWASALAVSLGVVGWASAASWADGMFDELSKDFGPVPRGPGLVHTFRLVNRTQTTVHVAGIRVSCGCVTATVSRDLLEPGQESNIVAHMDTRRFTGAKTVTIYVQFDRPQWEEVRLWLQAYGRDDVSISPESLTLGRIRRGMAQAVEVNVTLFGNWHVLAGRCDSNYVRVRLSEISGNEGTSVYRVEASLRPDAPVGRWFTDVWLDTDNPQAAQLRVPLTVEIASALSVSPSSVAMGDVKASSAQERRVVVRGVKPFRIVRIEGTDETLSVADGSNDARAVHVLTIRFKADTPGVLERTLRVQTDLPEDNHIEFQATATVIAQSPSDGGASASSP
jgi:hypothetical protein